MKFEIGKFYTDGNGNVYRFKGSRGESKFRFERSDSLCWLLDAQCSHESKILEGFAVCSDNEQASEFLSNIRKHAEAVVADYAHSARKGWNRA